MQSNVVLGMPLHLADRQRLRTMLGHPLSAIVSESVTTVCGCGMDLVIGPRSAAALAATPDARAMCPWCAAKFIHDHATEVQTQNLGNPESHFEPE